MVNDNERGSKLIGDTVLALLLPVEAEALSLIHSARLGIQRLAARREREAQAVTHAH
jgi:hypothetical protein